MSRCAIQCPEAERSTGPDAVRRTALPMPPNELSAKTEAGGVSTRKNPSVRRDLARFREPLYLCRPTS